MELILARLRDAADLYRELDRARRDRDDGARREEHLAGLDGEYVDDLAAAEQDQRRQRQEARRLEDELQRLEDKLRERRTRRPADAASALALGQEVEALRRRRDALEQQLLDRWQVGEQIAAEGMAEARAIAARRQDVAERRQQQHERAARAERALPEIEGELEHLRRQLPQRIQRRLTQIARRHPDPVADLIAGTCGGCGQSLPPQEAVDADREVVLVECQGCGRYVVARSSRRTRGWS